MKRHASMNRIYRLVWSRVQNAWIAVSENARGRGKSGRTRPLSKRGLIATAMALAFVPLAQAAPAGGQVTAGDGSIAQSGATTTVNQTSQNLSLSWQSFNTAAQETVNFVQPSASAVAVNRIYDTNGTQFFGHLNANGQVYLINPNGILFGAGSQVNVGGLVASTLDMSDASLNSASRSFSGNGTGSVVNRGLINGRYVALLGNTVDNQGSITANGGTAALGAGSAVTLTFADNGLVHMQVDQSTLDNLAGNGGLIRADGGMVLMSAGAKNALLASVVNNTGVIEARSVQNVNGTIVLDGGNGGTVGNSGTLDASGKNAGETGGTVKALGGTVNLLAGSNIDVSGDAGGGSVLVGGNFHGAGPEQNASTTTVATGAVINADAISSGNGGNIAVWSDVHTTVDGAFNARGGASGGNGGFVETSGAKLTVGRNTRIKTSAPSGKTGEWLLDPNDFTIGCDAMYCGTEVPGDILDTALSANLGDGTAGPGTNVTILSSQGANAGNGDITVLDAGVNGSAWVAWSAKTTLTLSAYRNVNVNGQLDPLTGGGEGSIELRADNTGTGIGTVNVAQGSTSGGTAIIFTQGAGSTTIYTNAPSSTTGYQQDGCNSFCGVFNVYQLVRTDTAGVVNNKTYDGTTAATLGTAFGLAGAPAGATLNAGTAAFADKNASTGKTVTFSGYSASGSVVMAGGVTANYFLATQPTATAADITPKALTESGLSVAASKVYDGSTAATVLGSAALLAAEAAGTGTTADGKAYTGDTVSITTGTATGTYNSKDVATASSVSYGGLSLTGAQAGNYSLTLQGNSAATITAKALTATMTAANKTYNVVTTAAPTFTITGGLIGIETVTATGTATFADKNVANGKTVTANTVTLASGTNGGLAGNYTLAAGQTATANITPATLTMSGITATNKVYDATTAATVNTAGAVFTGKIGGDAVTVSATGVFADKNVANGKTVTLTSTYGGADAGNYTITDQAGTTANITPAALTLGGITASNKVYDATTAATLNTAGVTFSGKIGADAVTLGGAGVGAFADKNVANGKTITVSGYTLGGADAGNYTVAQPTGLTANITPVALSLSGLTAANKVYDATTAATVNTAGAVFTGKIGGDAVTVSTTGAFADKNVANGKTVTLTSTYGGTDAGNYTITDQAGTTANITPAALTLGGITASNKVYDATTAATLNTAGVTFSGKIGTDVVTLGGAGVGAFVDKNVANGKIITVSGYTLGGADAGNYTVTPQAGLTANITPAALTVSGLTAANKEYDTTTAATVSTAGAIFTGELGTDLVTVSATGVFADKNVANGKTVTLTSTYGGADAGNYTITDQAGTTASITPKALTVTANAASKIYDGTAYSGGNGVIYTGFAGGETAAVLGGALTYGGSSQGAIDRGTYTITPGGLSSGNYALSYVDGVLTINAQPSAAVPQPAQNTIVQVQGSVLPPQASTQAMALSLSPTITVQRSNGAAQVNTTLRIGAMGPTLQIVNGGTRLPESMFDINDTKEQNL